MSGLTVHQSTLILKTTETQIYNDITIYQFCVFSIHHNPRILNSNYLIDFLNGKHYCSIKKKQGQICFLLIHQKKLFPRLMAEIIGAFEIHPVLEDDVVWGNKLIKVSKSEIKRNSKLLFYT